jgi:hypothetical protein
VSTLFLFAKSVGRGGLEVEIGEGMVKQNTSGAKDCPFDYAVTAER